MIIAFESAITGISADPRDGELLFCNMVKGKIMRLAEIEPKLEGVLFHENFEDTSVNARGWYDGKLVVEHTDVILRSTDFPNMKFNQFLMAPYFGPGLLPHAQKLWIDEMVVGTKRIGPLPRERRPAKAP